MKIVAIRGKNIASLEGEFAVDFTTEPLLTAGIFTITGPTGSGKSTLLDTMCLALFGKTPRSEFAKESEVRVKDIADDTMQQNDPRFLLRRGTASGYAEVDFISIDGESYRARWSVSRAREKETGRLQNYRISLYNISRKSEEQGTKSDLQNRIIELIGLTFDQFTRSVLLAQNDFSTFMKAKQAEKAALLEKLTGTEKYSVLSQIIYQKCNTAKSEYDEIRIRMEGVALLTEEEEQQLKDNLSWAEKEYHHLNSLIRDKRQLSEAVNTTEIQLKDYRTRHEEMVRKLELDTAELGRFRRQMAEAEERKNSLESEFKELQPQLAEARKLDIQLETKQPGVAEAEAVCKKVEAEQKENDHKLQVGDRAAEQIRKELFELNNWFQQNQSREMAAVRLTELLVHLEAAAFLHMKIQSSLQALMDKKEQLTCRKELTAKIEKQLLGKKKESNELLKIIHRLEEQSGAVSLASLEKEMSEMQEKREKALIETTRFEVKGNLKQMRAALTDGVACPVCGSTDHPYTTTHVIEKMQELVLEISRLTAAIETIKKQITDYHYLQQQIKENQKRHLLLQEELAAISTHYQQSISEINVLSGEINHGEKTVEEDTAKQGESLRKCGEFFPHNTTWQEQWKKDPVDFHNKLTAFSSVWQEKKTEKEKKERDLQVWESNRKLIESNRADIHKKLTEATLSFQKIQKEWSELKSKRSAFLDGKPADLVEDQYTQNLDRTRKESESLRKELEEKTKQVEQAKGGSGQLQKEIESTSLKLEEEKKRLFEWMQLNEQDYQEVSLEKSFEQSGQFRTELLVRLRTQEQHLQQIESFKAELEQKRSIWDQWAKLNDLAGSADGAKFRRIAQGYTLDILLSYANVQLKLLSGRYQLERVPETLALQVIDLDMCNEVRTVHSLSGGESFLVSLALALGLSSLSSSQMNVETLFIDEGFGSLDSDTLRVAIDALESLRTQGRKIGVISHVQEMTERIPTQIRVCRSSNGRSHLVIDH